MISIKFPGFFFLSTILFVLTMSACSATKETSSTISETSTGQEIEQAYCKSCHGLPSSMASYTSASKWESVISRMETTNNANLSSMSADQRQILIDYLVASSSN